MVGPGETATRQARGWRGVVTRLALLVVIGSGAALCIVAVAGHVMSRPTVAEPASRGSWVHAAVLLLCGAALGCDALVAWRAVCLGTGRRSNVRRALLSLSPALVLALLALAAGGAAFWLDSDQWPAVWVRSLVNTGRAGPAKVTGAGLQRPGGGQDVCGATSEGAGGERSGRDDAH